MRYLLILFFLLPLVSRADISVVTSIRPLYQITAAIMHDVGEPQLLIKHEHSTHHFAFKPSHFRLLQKANLVIWIDRHFESGFIRLPGLLADTSRQIELLPALGLQGQDGHIWYSPAHLLEISAHIATVLIEMDSANRSVYERNRENFQQAVTAWRRNMQSFLAEYQPKYLLDHDFLSHFHQEFKVSAVAVIHNSHDQHGGIKALQKVEQQLHAQPANCLISNESEFPQIGNNLAERFNLSRKRLDTYADDGPPETRFLRHLQHFAEVLQSC